jgi:hypothetical protein
MHFIQAVLVLAVGAMAVYVLRRFGAGGSPEALDGLRDIFRSARVQVAALGTNSGDAADLSTLISSLYRSAVSRRRALWWTRKTVISGQQWVVLANPADYLAITSDLDVIVEDLGAAFKQSSAAQRLVFSGSLEVVQVLSRASVPPGRPELMTYARARSIELMDDAMVADYVQTETPLMTPDEVVAAARNEVRPVPFEAFSTPRASAAASNATTYSAVRDRGGTTLAVGKGLGLLELTHAPDELELVPIPVEAGLVLGRDPAHGSGCIPVSKVSSTHAEIVEGQDGPVIVDCGSTNGLYVNGAPVATETLFDGATVGLGRHVTLRYSAAAAPMTQTD